MSSPGSSVGRAQISGEETRGYTLQPIPPQVFGKYTLIGKLGHGGMAEVLLAVMGGKAGFRKLVVLKRLHAQLEIEPDLIGMFLDEARLAAQLDHPNCVQTIEVGAANDPAGHEQHFLAMEYLDGQGLDRLLRASAQSGILLPIAMAIRIVADALEGLGYAHELASFDGKPLGVVHRDVSPQNIFVTYNGIVKLLDFGIAKAESNVVETRTGVVKGKYAYIAPEQALGQPVDPRADLWSMGVVLWECLTSRRLFKSVNELATLQETLRGEIKPPSAFNREIDPELDAIVMRALQREVRDRFESASAFKDALEGWLEAHGGARSRKQIAAMMKERFEEVHRVHREKLAACLAALEVGPSGIQSLVEASHATTSGQFSNLTPSSARPISGPPSITPTPMPAAAPAALAPSSEPEDRRRVIAWRLIGVASIALVAVLIGIALPRYQAAREAALAPGGGAGVAEGAPGGPASTRSTPESTTAAQATIAAPGAPDSLPIDPSAAGTADSLPIDPSAAADSFPMDPAGAGSADSLRIDPAGGAMPSDRAAGTIDPTPGDRAASSSVPLDRMGAPGDRAVASPTEPESSGRSAHADPDRRDRRASRSTTEPATGAPPEPAPPPPEERFGYLSLATSPWTTVTLDGRTLGDTPLVRERLPAGRHTLRLSNADQGISEIYEVEIRPGETTTRRLGLR